MAGAEGVQMLRQTAAELATGARAALEVAVGARAPGTVLTSSEAGTAELRQILLLSAGLLIVARSFQASVKFLCGVFGMRSKPKRRKLAESLREQVWYSMSLFLWWRCLGHHPWLQDLSTCFSHDSATGLPSETGGVGPRIALEFKFIYLFELAWYISGAISLLLDPKKKDFKQMALHHFATIVLIAGSAWNGQYQVGAVVYFLHNISDPFLHWAKLLNYLGSELPCNLAFVGYMLSFGITRLLYYPYLMYTVEFHGPGPGGRGGPNTWSECILIRFLVLLFPIHVFWFSIIVKVAHRSLTAGAPVKDSRSDDEYDSDFDEDPREGKKKQ